jgi:threonine/homoserine/homoserine lactone efflux protein
MTPADWLAFAGFWAVFVTAPGPNAVNCVANGMTYGFARGLWGVAGILTQAAVFLTLAAAGVAAALAAAPAVEGWLRLGGAAVLVWLGLRTVARAGRAVAVHPGRGSIYGRALLIATVNAKSLAGYLAAFTQVLRADAALWGQMLWIYPTALTLTAASYCGYTALGALAGRSAMAAVMNLWFRRAMGVAFVAYGLALAASGPLPFAAG